MECNRQLITGGGDGSCSGSGDSGACFKKIGEVDAEHQTIQRRHKGKATKKERETFKTQLIKLYMVPRIMFSSTSTRKHQRSNNSCNKDKP